MRESNNHIPISNFDNDPNNHNNIEGEGFVDFLKNPITRIKAISKGVRKNYPPKVRQMLELNGDKKITISEALRLKK